MIDDPERAAARNRLRILIIADATLAGVAGIFTVTMAASVAPIAALFWLGVFVIAISVLIASALRPLRREDVFHAVLQFSVANWVVAVVAAAVATFAWPLMLQVTILPGILAASYVSRRQLAFFASASFAAAVMVACLGLLQDVTGGFTTGGRHFVRKRTRRWCDSCGQSGRSGLGGRRRNRCRQQDSGPDDCDPGGDMWANGILHDAAPWLGA